MNKSFISTSPIPDFCAKCKSAIWSCHVIGFAVKLAPTPLNFEAEFLARGRGVRIFQTTREQLVKMRGLAEIEKSNGSEIVLAAHECDQLDFTIPHDLFHKPQPVTYSSEGFPF